MMKSRLLSAVCALIVTPSFLGAQCVCAATRTGYAPFLSNSDYSVCGTYYPPLPSDNHNGDCCLPIQCSFHWTMDFSIYSPLGKQPKVEAIIALDGFDVARVVLWPTSGNLYLHTYTIDALNYAVCGHILGGRIRFSGTFSGDSGNITMTCGSCGV
jgi:hypothetical protein